MTEVIREVDALVGAGYREVVILASTWVAGGETWPPALSI
jgi:hypothetical protein